MKGRPRKAIEVKEAQGTVNKTRARQEAEIRYTGDENYSITLPPDDLSERAKEIWLKIVSQHASIGLNFPSHYEYLEVYCRMYDVRQAAFEELDNEGKYQVDDKGIKRINPSWKVLQEAIGTMLTVGAKLGLSAADKTKISTSILSGSTADKNKQKRIGVTG